MRRLFALDVSGGMPQRHIELGVSFMQDGDHVVHFDSRLYDKGIYHTGDDLEKFKPSRAGGGTMFKNVMEFAYLNQFDEVLVVTDGYLSETPGELYKMLKAYDVTTKLVLVDDSLQDQLTDIFGSDNILAVFRN